MSTKRFPLFPFFLLATLAGMIWAGYRYGEQWLRHSLIYLSHAAWARKLVSNLPLARRVAGRFVAGESLPEAMQAVQHLQAKGMRVTLDYLGEHVSSEAEAAAARDQILALLDSIQAHKLGDAYVSVKLSQLGLRLGEEVALANMRQLLHRARQYGNRIRIDMEESAVTDVTLGIYRTLRQEFPNVGIVIQAYLFRSEADVQQLIAEGAWVRLCKGAYAESPEVAFALKADTDTNFIKLMRLMLSDMARARGVSVGVASHDEKMIAATIDYVQAQGIPPQAFEFQMLYGIRRELQESLVRQGYGVRVYVPYGTAWYPYFVRRLAERPANLWFFASNLVKR